MNNKNTHAYMQAAVKMMFNQMHAKKGIKLFGERYIAPTIKEFKQLNECEIPVKPFVFPINPDKLTDAESRQALESVNLIMGG